LLLCSLIVTAHSYCTVIPGSRETVLLGRKTKIVAGTLAVVDDLRSWHVLFLKTGLRLHELQREALDTYDPGLYSEMLPLLSSNAELVEPDSLLFMYYSRYRVLHNYIDILLDHFHCTAHVTGAV
jgi:hypothetical protein